MYSISHLGELENISPKDSSPVVPCNTCTVTGYISKDSLQSWEQELACAGMWVLEVSRVHCHPAPHSFISMNNKILLDRDINVIYISVMITFRMEL